MRSNLAEMLSNDVHDLVVRQAEWRQTLVSGLEEIESKGPEWKYDKELMEALIAVLDSGPARVSPQSPDHSAFQSMLKEIDYRPGIPSMQTKALTSTEEEFREQFRGLFTGQSWFRDSLDRLLANVVATRTLLPDYRERCEAALSKLEQVLKERNEREIGSVESELALIGGLREILNGQSPDLAEINEYRSRLRDTLESIRIFHADSEAGDQLTQEEIWRVSIMTPGVLTIGREHYDQFKQWLEVMLSRVSASSNAHAFIEALLITLSERPAELPLENPYRPYLKLIDAQLKQLRSDRDSENSMSTSSTST